MISFKLVQAVSGSYALTVPMASRQTRRMPATQIRNLFVWVMV
jgi:hypothetical protein